MNEELISSNIKMIRKNRSMTLDRLAALAGLIKGYLSKIERSKKAPPYSTINKIAIAFGVDAASFLGKRFTETETTKISFTRKRPWAYRVYRSTTFRGLAVWVQLRGTGGE